MMEMAGSESQRVGRTLLSGTWRRSPRAGAEPKGEEKAGVVFSAGGGGSNSDNAGPPNGEESMMECGGDGG
jgi:hypothetical protein